MPKSLTHAFVSAIADGTDATLVRKTNWNDDHDFWLGYRSVTTTADTLANSDHLSVVVYNSVAAVAVTLPAPAGGNMPSGWTTKLRNISSGVVTVTGGGGATINGSASQALNQGDTLELFSGGTAAYQAVATKAPAAGGGAALVQYGGKLSYVSATALQFVPFMGGYVALNGAQRAIPSGGIAGLANTGVFVGGVAAQNLAANTVYFVYVFDNAGALTADFWTTAAGPHATSSTAGNVGVEIRSGDNTRSLIGIIRTIAAGQFADSATQRFVRSWFNRNTVALSRNATATLTTASTTLVELSTNLRIEVVVFSNDTVLGSLSSEAWANGSSESAFAIGWDGAADANRLVEIGSAGVSCGLCLVQIKALAEGYHYLTVMAANEGAWTTNFGYASDMGWINAQINPPVI